MLKHFKRKKESPITDKTTEKKGGLLNRLKSGLSKTRLSFTNTLADTLLGKKIIDDELLEEIETLLLTSDMGYDVTQKIINDLSQQLSRKALNDGKAVFDALKDQLAQLLLPVEIPLKIHEEHHPTVILVVGVNGTGKTTTIGKLAKKLQDEGKKVVLAAGDTFRAAAIEQLQVWGERINVPVIAQQIGADSASVIFDAIQSAKARNADVLIADTAGRLHTQTNLMEELKKIVLVIKKLDYKAPHEIMLVLDAGIGQNALSQAKKFNEAVNLTGITLTKLDGTARGGMIFAIANQLKLPIRFIGVGEQVDDLQPFNTRVFVDALFSFDEMQHNND